MKKKDFVRLALCASAISMLGACGGSADTPSEANQTAAATEPPAAMGMNETLPDNVSAATDPAATEGNNMMAEAPANTVEAEPKATTNTAAPAATKAGAAATPKAGAAATPKAGAAATPAATPAAAARPASFALCATCHTAEPGGPHKIGPNLAGVVGSKAASKAGFNYSDAMKNSGITWTRAELDEFIAAPRAKVPGTKMFVVGPKEAARRQEIIDYLAAQK